MRCRVCGEARLRDLGVVDRHAFYECLQCEFAFTPDVTGRDADDLYRRPMNDTPTYGWADESFLETSLRRLGPGPLEILDFGTGQSTLPEALRRRGHRVIAIDTAPPERPHPDRLTGSLFELKLQEGLFDLAFAFQVFEHLPRPAPFLAELLRITRPGGIVVVHTDMHLPERDDVTFRDWWYVMPPVHCSFYRHRTFEQLLKDTPHRLLERAPKYVAIERRASI